MRNRLSGALQRYLVIAAPELLSPLSHSVLRLTTPGQPQLVIVHISAHLVRLCLDQQLISFVLFSLLVYQAHKSKLSQIAAPLSLPGKRCLTVIEALKLCKDRVCLAFLAFSISCSGGRAIDAIVANVLVVLST